jgi:hypothetical protein
VRVKYHTSRISQKLFLVKPSVNQLSQIRDGLKQICLDLDGVGKVGPNIGNLSWRENVFKLASNEARYCDAGPLRPPFRIVPHEVIDNGKKIAAYWKSLCEKYPGERLAKIA